MRCSDLTYEVGRIYTSNKFLITMKGFHYCNDIETCKKYYNFSREDLEVIEVEILGDCDHYSKVGVTNKLKVLRVVPKEEYIDLIPPEKCKCPTIPRKENTNHGKDIFSYSYNDEGVCIKETREYYAEDRLMKYEITYDGCGNKLKMSANFSNDETWEYDSNNNMIKHIDSDGFVYEITIE